ncbi:hypothetical protein [Streptomyces sp. SID3343]|uniref:hypothetical protein n=1 Tax=Streptomyces sp. SID3343 TaxID=2690260 RepID=UPI00136FF3A0|nr:hypothetical protein [Streptomyces sp. SID3343]MYV97569.1 hypothetical protein [Streptomyces sp. SID3343]
MTTDWSQLHHFWGPADDIPVLFADLTPGNREQTWLELSNKLCLDEGVCAASFAAVPLLWAVAVDGAPPDRDAALSLAGQIVAAGRRHRENDSALDPHASRIAHMATLADAHLSEHAQQTDYILWLREMLALEGHLAWAWTLDDLTDAFFAAHCPHSDADVTIAVGDYGHYSAIRDWERGDIDRRPLRPTRPEEMSPLGARLLGIAIRDQWNSLARGLPYVFGTANARLAERCSRWLPHSRTVSAPRPA